MLHDPCSKCGHRRKRTMMSTDPNSASLSEMWRGEGEWWQATLLKAACLAVVFLTVYAILLGMA